MISMKASGIREERCVTISYTDEDELTGGLVMVERPKMHPEAMVEKWEHEIYGMIFDEMRVGETVVRYPDPRFIEWMMRRFFCNECEFTAEGDTSQLEWGQLDPNVVY